MFSFQNDFIDEVISIVITITWQLITLSRYET